jgi:N6-L-threonylcarbamoyladenine synthase
VIVGIECTAHTFGVGVVNNGKILENVRDMYMPAKGGIVPIESAKHHMAVAESVWRQAIGGAGVSDKQIGAIAVSTAPNLGS